MMVVMLLRVGRVNGSRLDGDGAHFLWVVAAQKF
jgi:hypothetical protein